MGKFVFEHATAQIITAPAQIITAPAQTPATGAVVYTALFPVRTLVFMVKVQLPMDRSFTYASCFASDHLMEGQQISVDM